MTRKELVQLISQRLLQIRNSLKYSRSQMARAMHSSESSYYKNEKAKTSPDLLNYHAISKAFNVSLDWLIAGRGEMFYQEPQSALPAESEQHPALMDEDLRRDVKELLVHMEHIPMLRYEVLAMFQHFKANNKELVAESVKELPAALPVGTLPE